MLLYVIIAILVLIVVAESIYISYLSRNKNKKTNMEETKKFFRGLWAKFAIYVIATSVIGLFIASFVSNQVITLTTMNEWVSLVLGLVALIIGIISLWLSFYNVDQSMKSQEDNLKIMQAVKEEIGRELRNTQSIILDEMNKIPERTANYRVTNKGRFMSNLNNSKNWSENNEKNNKN